MDRRSNPNGRVSLAAIERLVALALTRHGAADAQAAAVARVVAAAERDGAESHGLFRLPGYVASLKSGKVDGRATPVLQQTAPGVLSVDAACGFAPLALEVGLPALAAMAHDTGIAALAVRNCFHFAALWPEVETLAQDDLVGLAVTAATPMVAPAGAGVPFFGTNPMAFAFPREGAPPVVIDQASAAMARGDIMLAARDGRTVPEGVGLGPDGAPTTDPGAILAGAQLAFGGYKGASIALMVELLAGAVAGDLFSPEAGAIDNGDGGPPRGGELVIAIDPDRFGHGRDWRQRSSAFLEALLKLEGTRLPGSRRHGNRARSEEEGVILSDANRTALASLSGETPP
ncbi:MAG: Ldh family oxidoreductase [Pseudomonadota bacterium]